MLKTFSVILNWCTVHASEVHLSGAVVSWAQFFCKKLLFSHWIKLTDASCWVHAQSLENFKKVNLSLFQHVVKQKRHNCCFVLFFLFIFLDCPVYACLTCTFISAFCYPFWTVWVCEFFIITQGQYLGRYLLCPVTDCTFMPSSLSLPENAALVIAADFLSSYVHMWWTLISLLSTL